MTHYRDKLTDESLMPFGIYVNNPMANVPAEYLLWLYDNNKCTTPVQEYIEENLTVLRNEAKK